MRPEAVSTKHLGQRSARNSDQYCFFGIKKSHYAQLSSLTLSNHRASHKHTENTPTDIRLTAIYETIELWKQVVFQVMNSFVFLLFQVVCSALQGQPFVYMFANCSLLLEINIYYKHLCAVAMTSTRNSLVICAKANYFIKGKIFTK